MHGLAGVHRYSYGVVYSHHSIRVCIPGLLFDHIEKKYSGEQNLGKAQVADLNEGGGWTYKFDKF